MATLKEDMRSDASIERAMAASNWGLDELQREVELGRFGGDSTAKSKSISEYIDRKRRQGRTQAENDAYDLNLRMVTANEASAKAAQSSAWSAAIAVGVSLVALAAAVLALYLGK